MQCTAHGSASTHFCFNRSCLQALCPECRLSHKSAHPSNKDELPLDKAVERCRQKLNQDFRNLDSAFAALDNQLIALEAVEESKRQLDRHMDDIVDRTRRFFSQLKAELDIRNAHLEQVLGQAAAIRQANEMKRRVNALRLSLQSEADIRDALEFDCDRVYVDLKSKDLRPIAEYFVYSPAYAPEVQIPKPDLVRRPLAAGSPSYLPKAVGNLSSQHFIITEPAESGPESDALFFFDSAKNCLRTFHLKEGCWRVHTPPATQPPFPAFGSAVSVGRKYFYFGGQATDGAKSGVIFCYDSGEVRWEALRHMARERSSFASTVVRTAKSALVLVAGGLDGAQKPIKDCEVFSPDSGESARVAPLNFAASNSCLCTFSDNFVLKAGGLASGGPHQQICRAFERYDLRKDRWILLNTEVCLEPGLRPQDLCRFFYANSCAARINDSEMFVFGGHGADSQGTTESYIFKVEELAGLDSDPKYKYSIRFGGLKPLPRGEAFSGARPILYNKAIYVLQDVEHTFAQVLSSDKAVLKFDGYEWSLYEQVYS